MRHGRDRYEFFGSRWALGYSSENAADAAGTPKATGNAPIPPADSTVAVGGHAVPTRAETRP